MKCPSCETSVDGGSPRFCPNCGAALSSSHSDAAGSGPATADRMIGQLLGGKFKVVRLLGEGGMGAVYEGEQPLGTAKRKVAVKTLHPHLSRDPKVQARFEREVATISELEHPNTIQVYDFGRTPDGILYFVMEFLHGGSVADRLAADGAMAPRRASHILEQVCGSLEEAHGRGIVHRDLKPDNVVLIERAGQKDFVKVLDFGIAKRMTATDSDEVRLTQQGMVVGTPPYMSPEQFSGRGIDARSDIYSVGVMAYEMLTGKLPFYATTAWEWAARHMSQPPIPIESLAEGKNVPQSMRAAIQRALAKSPDERFQTARSFVDAFSGASVASTVAMDDEPGARKTERGVPVGFVAPAESVGAEREAFRAGPIPYTPIGGSMAFPTPIALAEPATAPAGQRRGRRRRRGAFLAVAGVMGAGSALALGVALKGQARRDAGRSLDSSASSYAAAPAAPATSIAPADLNVGDLAADTAGASSDIPPLATGSARPEHSAPRAPLPPASSPGPSGSSARPGPVAGGDVPQGGRVAAVPTLQSLPPSGGGPAGASLPSTQPTTPAPSPAHYDGPECEKARILRAYGRNREARSWTLACLAKGGTVE